MAEVLDFLENSGLRRPHPHRNKYEALCERFSGKKAKVTYIPKSALAIIRNFFRLFEFTWNIADRLQFSELSTNNLAFNN
jgi:hypothetical protein